MEIKLVKCNGLDNKTFRLVNTMLIRIPTAQCYTLSVLKEQKGLKILKPYLSLTIHEPIALGQPSNFYPWNGSIYKGIEGESANLINTTRVNQIGDDALKSKGTKNPVGIHGDLSSGNFLVKNNNVTAIIDFENIAIGDPACDLVIAGTLLDKQSRNLFKSNLNNLDGETWNRAKGGELGKAIITIVKSQDKNQLEVVKQQKIINEIINCNL